MIESQDGAAPIVELEIQCYQTWLNSAKVAYFRTPWRVKKWWRKPPKKWLIFGSIKILAKKGQNSNFNLDLGIFYTVISKLC